MRPAYLYNLLSLSGHYFWAVPSENLIIGLITGGKPKEARGFAHKGIPRWSLLMIVIPVLNTCTQLALGHGMLNSHIWLSHYLYKYALRNQIAMENNLPLNIYGVSILLGFCPCLCIFYQLHPYTLVCLNSPGASSYSITRQ